jgi:hypothetical protein
MIPLAEQDSGIGVQLIEPSHKACMAVHRIFDLLKIVLTRPSQLGHGIGDFCEMKGGKCESIQGRTIWKRL